MADKKATVRKNRQMTAAKRSAAAKKAAATRKANETNQGLPWFVWVLLGLLLGAVIYMIAIGGVTQKPVIVLDDVPAPVAVETPAAPAVVEPAPASGNDYQGTDACKDGSDLPNAFADISRIPLGNREGASVYEVTWKPGTGFGGFYRIVLVLSRMDETHMAFVNNAATVHGLRYCGSLKDIIAYAPHHVDALMQSSQDHNGQRPSADEIPVVYLSLDGTVTITKAAPNGPSMDEIKAHLEMTP